MFEDAFRVIEIAVTALGYQGDASQLILITILVFARFLTFALFVPGFGTGSRAYAGKIAVALALTVVGTPVALAGAGEAGGALFFGYLFKEVLIGCCFGFLFGLFFEAAKAVGSLIQDYIHTTAGALGSSSAVDLASFKLILASLLFFVSGAYVPVFAGLSESLIRIPVTAPVKAFAVESWFPIIVETGFAFFAISIAIALPFLFVLFTADLVIAVTTRLVPELRGIALGLPVRVLVITVGLALMLQVITLRFSESFSEGVKVIERLVELFAG